MRSFIAKRVVGTMVAGAALAVRESESPPPSTPPLKGRMMTKDDRELIEALRNWPAAQDGDALSAGFVSALLASAATRLEALQAQPVGEESGWLIEENASGIIHWIALAENEWPRHERVEVKRSDIPRLLSDDDWEIDKRRYLSPIKRVKDANEALRFARKEDAEALIKLFDQFLLCPVATEHMWSAVQ